MSRNSAGVYSLPAGNPVVTNTPIATAWANGTFGDVRDEITNSLDRGGRGGMTGQFKAIDGAAAAPGIAFVTDTDTGFARLAENKFAVVCGGVIKAMYDVNSQPKGGFSPLDEGAVGDGITPDDVAFAALKARLQTFVDLTSTVVPYGQFITIDLQGRVYALQNKFDTGTMDGIQIVNGALVRVAGGTLSPTVPLLHFPSNSINCRARNVFLDGGKFCAGIDLEGTSAKAIDCIIYHFQGFGLRFTDSVSGGADRFAQGCNITQWFNGDGEFALDANYTADGIRFDDNDCEAYECLVRWCGTPVRFTTNGDTCTFSGGHIYNGGSGVIDRSHPKGIIVEAGAGSIRIIDVYLDNVECDLYNDDVSFYGCSALYTLANATLDYMVCLFANGQTGPSAFRTGNWFIVSAQLQNGTTPLIDFQPFGADAWSGNYDNFVNFASGNKEVKGSWAVSKVQVDTIPNLTLFTPGASSFGSRLALVDNETDMTDLAVLPMIRSQGDKLLLINKHAAYNQTTANATIGKDDSNEVLHVFNGGSAGVITINPDLRTGFEHTVVVHGAGPVTFQTTGSGSIESFGGTGPFVSLGAASVVKIYCGQNSGGSSALITLSGDVA